MKKLTRKKDKDAAREPVSERKLATTEEVKKPKAQCCAKISTVVVGCHD